LELGVGMLSAAAELVEELATVARVILGGAELHEESVSRLDP